MATKGQLFKFEQKQQYTIKDKGLDSISDGDFDSCFFSCKNNKVSVMRKKGDSIETFTAENTKHGDFFKATKINRPNSKEERKDTYRYLNKKGMTQTEIAMATDTSQSTVSKYLNAQ